MLTFYTAGPETFIFYVVLVKIYDPADEIALPNDHYHKIQGMGTGHADQHQRVMQQLTKEK